jgi:hypothetical protein
VLVCAAVSALLGPLGWNAILHATHADQFFYDAPIPVFPIGRQDTGSGMLIIAVAAVQLGFGPLRTDAARRLAGLRPLPASTHCSSRSTCTEHATSAPTRPGLRQLTD